MFGHRPRVKTPAQIMTELDGLWQSGWRGTVFFVRRQFHRQQARVARGIAPALVRWHKGKRGFSFYTEASINLADDEDLMRLMVAAAFDQVFIGSRLPKRQASPNATSAEPEPRSLSPT